MWAPVLRVAPASRGHCAGFCAQTIRQLINHLTTGEARADVRPHRPRKDRCAHRDEWQETMRWTTWASGGISAVMSERRSSSPF